MRKLALAGWAPQVGLRCSCCFSLHIRANRSGHALPLQDGQQLERIDGANIPKIKSCIVTKAPSNKG